MHILVGLSLLIHGVAHLAGLVSAWSLMPATVPPMTVLAGGRLELGPTGTRILGLLWLLLAVSFAIAGVAAMLRSDWWVRITLAAAAASLLLCAAAWSEAKAGAVIDVAILVLLIALPFTGWRMAG